MQPHYQVAIAGGGPAGAAAAIMLARMGYQVLLADAAPALCFRVGEGLPPAAKSLLNDLGVMKQFMADAHRPSMGNVSVWGSEQPQCHDFVRTLHGHGFQLDRARFDAMLRQTAASHGVTLLAQTRIGLASSSSLTSPLQLTLQTSQGTANSQGGQSNASEITADFLIDATGRAASLARKLGAGREQFDQLLAFHALLSSEATENATDTGTDARAEAETDQDGRTMIEAVENGWWYSVLLPSRQRLVSFMGDADLLDKASLLSSDGFYTQLMATRFLRELCQRHAYQISRAPLGADASSSCLNQMVGPNWLAVGDAAMAFDPLSSQGIANAMYGGMQAAQAIHACLAEKQTNAKPGPSALAQQLLHPALRQYQAQASRIFDAYLANRRSFYGDEQRWPQQAFWQRRHQHL